MQKEEIKSGVNREHKDRLFCLLFGEERNRKNLLEMYNALNHTNYSEPEDLRITTLEDVIYMGMKNDVSLLLHSRMALYEHQSTYNPNMPVRGMIYAAKLYEKYIEDNNLNIYGTKRIKLPMPQYIVFYNGNAECADEEILKLSDAFMVDKKAEGYEWTARMLNINYGRNRELLEQCKPLKEYAIFVDKVKRYAKQRHSMKEAIEQAVKECIKEDIMAEFLRTHRAEVMDVCITEYNEERVLNAIREEGREEGFAKGHTEGRAEGIEKGIQILIEICGELKKTKEDTISILMEKYSLTLEKAQAYADEFYRQ